MKQIINGADLRRMIISAAAAVEINKQALNDLNVFPVPDGDTGTNMSMTINAAAGDLRKTEDPSLEKAAKVAASAMLRADGTLKYPEEYSLNIFLRFGSGSSEVCKASNSLVSKNDSSCTKITFGLSSVSARLSVI